MSHILFKVSLRSVGTLKSVQDLHKAILGDVAVVFAVFCLKPDFQASVDVIIRVNIIAEALSYFFLELYVLAGVTNQVLDCLEHFYCPLLFGVNHLKNLLELQLREGTVKLEHSLSESLEGQGWVSQTKLHSIEQIICR